MTTPARHAEADRVETVYQWALVQLGVGTIDEALALWDQVPASQQAATATGWLSKAISLIMLRRFRAREIALSYYRLIRALRTGTTIQKPGKPEPQYVSLEMLRREFESLIEDVAAERPQAGSQGAESREGSDTPPPAQEAESAPPAVETEASEPSDEPLDDDDAILLEEIRELELLIEQADAAAEDEAREVMDQLGIENLLKKLDQIPEDAEHAAAQDAAKQAHEEAGSRQASAAERISLNAARGLTYNLSSTDERVMGWVRYSTTGTPCGWCAMLISRGPVYKSKATAATSEVGNQFHDNDYCIAVPVFSREQFDNSPLFNLNREYSALWPKVTQGKGGKEALRLWRRYFRQLRKDADAQAA